MGQGGLSKKAKQVQEDSTCKGIQGSTSKEEIKCVCLNARSIINKKDELNIMVDDIKPHYTSRTLYQHMKYSFRRKKIAMKPYGAN